MASAGVRRLSPPARKPVLHFDLDWPAGAREQLARYLSLPDARLKTVAGWRGMAYSQHPAYLALRERIYDGLQMAGMAVQ
ncbi:hypothetical protein JQ596_01750 [Bradyrhizobium manausense]|uniref:hypothetical protein n=1 Tax=Bradyrhizobium TaxID=374 RepID=UPI001BA8159C|nr:MULTISPECIES: hypothetical protein [Bradyrhizobium]MBR0824243.1 hypothetical protein [Bradyrhizobium manausense]UVO26644.1 hypothetical protein KUF59_29355 [Bradyrhizobium arachidis]